jgi:hypothetical protein
VDFVLVGILLTFVLLALVQLCLVLYVRNALVESAAAGARYGANADLGTSDAVVRTRDLIRTAVTGSIAPTVTGSTHVERGLQVVEVDVTAPIPALGFLTIGATMHVTGRAFKEGQ